jgi:hypothetical protein
MSHLQDEEACVRWVVVSILHYCGCGVRSSRALWEIGRQGLDRSCGSIESSLDQVRL